MSLRTIRGGMSSAGHFCWLFCSPCRRAQHNAPRIDLAITYATTHSNTTASNGFWLKSGALELDARFFRGLSLMASATGLNAPSVDRTGGYGHDRVRAEL